MQSGFLTNGVRWLVLLIVSVPGLTVAATGENSIQLELPAGIYCEPGKDAREAIARVDRILADEGYRGAASELVQQAKAAAGPPECDSVRAKILADKAAWLLAPQSEEIQPFQSKASLGVGLGITYGYFLGFNLHHQITEKVAMSYSIGSDIDGGFASNVGIRYFPRAQLSNFNLSMFYGTNALINEEECAIPFLPFCGDYSTYRGLTVGIGTSSRDASSGWQIDLLYILTSDAFDRVEELEDRGDFVKGPEDSFFSLSFGYQW